ncbi:aminotransferase class I/II-fold pyridoxal phosphate-dependent enzyme, partial [Xanthomonas citri pv. citri]|nr:aminotransferase class I/II-fold pyridoxal phosphate-dependent enzyme [Xanthomonas citri pv. citri]
LQQQGFYCLPIRPPTVPKGTARIRLSLTADVTTEELDRLIACL